MSRINYNMLAVPGLEVVLIQISTVCQELEIDFFIVGAIARNIWHAIHNENPQGTKDIDLGIYVPTTDKYNALRKLLVDRYGYKISSTNSFCLIDRKGIQIDLLPFGEIEEDGKVMIEGKGLTQISLWGFQESYDLGKQEVKIGEALYKVCSIPAIVILKLVAFDDRPNERIKDARDINSIFLYYPKLEADHIWSNHFDLYDGHLPHDEVGLIVLGREIKRIIAANLQLKERIVKILDMALQRESNLLEQMINDPQSETLTMKANFLQKIKQGIID